MDIFQKPDVIFFRIKTGSEPARNIYFSGVLRSAIYRRGIFSENIRFRRIFARKISVSHQFDVKNIGFVWWKISVFVQNFFKITTFRNGYFSPFIGTTPCCRTCDNKVSHFDVWLLVVRKDRASLNQAGLLNEHCISSCDVVQL